MALLETLITKLTLDGSEYKKGLAEAQGDTGSFVSKIGGIAGGAAIATGAAVAGAALAVGKAALDMEAQYDDAIDNIINGTGASGEALEAMGQSVRNLAKSSAGLGHEMGSIGSVIAEVNTRTGATGKTLEDFAGNILKYSRLTGVDGVKATQNVTRVMGDWGVAMEDSAGLLDKIYGAGQAFGISTDSLSQKLVQFGAPLRQMGFSLDESIAMFGKWEKEGVNAELVIGSLRIAAGKFADQGVDLREGLLSTMEAIKGASSESEALSLAMETFGARAGPDMAAAIREGRFELDSAMAALQATQGGLNDAAERTIGFREQWSIAMAQIGDALIPLGNKLAELAEKIMPAVIWAIQGIIAIITPLIDWIVAGVDALVTFIETNQQVQAIVGVVGEALSNLGNIFGSVFGGLQGNLEETAPLLTWFGDLFGWLGEHVTQMVNQNLNFFRGWIDQNMPRIQKIVETVLGAIQGFWEANGQGITEAIQRYWGWILEFLSLLFRTILNTLQFFLQVFTGDWEGASQTVQMIVRDLWTTLTGIFGDMINAIIQLFTSVDWGGIGRAIVQGIINGLQSAAGWLWQQAQQLAWNALDAAKSALGIRSPSKEAAKQIGRPFAEGFGVGVEDSLSRVGARLDAAFGDVTASINIPTPNGGPGRGVGPINITINVNGPGEPNILRRAVRDGLLEGLRATGAA